MEFDTDRRAFLQAAGAGAALSLAGCGGDAAPATDEGTTADGDPTSGDVDGPTASHTPAEPRTVTVTVRPDQARLRERQRTLRAEVSAGNISRETARRRYDTARRELRAEAVASFETRAEADVTVTDTVPELGVLSVSGRPAALLDTFAVDAVAALLPPAAFEQARERARRETATETPAGG